MRVSERADSTIPIHLVQGRAKSIDSLRGKLRHKQYPNPSTQVTDLIGVRVITYSWDDLDRVDTEVRNWIDISERKSLMEHLKKMAEHDGLTGQYNRTYFTEELERAVHRVKRGGQSCALLYFDLDNFKYISSFLQIIFILIKNKLKRCGN